MSERPLVLWMFILRYSFIERPFCLFLRHSVESLWSQDEVKTFDQMDEEKVHRMLRLVLTLTALMAQSIRWK